MFEITKTLNRLHSNTMKYTLMGISIVSLTMLSGCLDDNNKNFEKNVVDFEQDGMVGDVSSTAEVLEKINTGNEGYVEIIEAEPGVIFYNEVYPIGTPRPLEGMNNSSLDDVYTKLTGNVPPENILAAKIRQETFKNNHKSKPNFSSSNMENNESRPEQGQTLLKSSATQASSGFKEDWCLHGDWSINWMGSTGNGSFSRYDINYGVSAVRNNSGSSVTHSCSYRTWSTWKSVSSVRVLNGKTNSQSVSDIWTDFDFKCATTNGAGAFYDWCAYGLR